MTTTEKTIEERFRKLSHYKHILERPDTYVGNLTHAKSEDEMWTLTDDESDDSGRSAARQLVRRHVTYTPALYKIFDEILTNACDHKTVDSTMTKIKVVINQQEGTVSVYNNGNKGILYFPKVPILPCIMYAFASQKAYLNASCRYPY
jgi:DNA topoisomerase II